MEFNEWSVGCRMTASYYWALVRGYYDCQLDKERHEMGVIVILGLCVARILSIMTLKSKLL